MTEPTSDAQDVSDMAALASGRDAALNNLMERHGQRLFHYLIRQSQNEADAAEVAQETFVRIYQNRMKFDPRQKFSTWLYTIATNLSRDRLRWRGRHPQISLEAEDERSGTALVKNLADTKPAPDKQLESNERAETVRKAVAALPEDLRTPLILTEYEERSHAEVAAILNCSPKAVEMRIYRARNRLRQDLAGLVETA